MVKKPAHYAAYTFVILLTLGFAGYLAFQKLTSPPSPVNPVLADAGTRVTLMDFTTPPSLEPITSGWWQLGFMTKPYMKVSFVEKDSVKALRCETSRSGSMFGRHTDINLAAFPKLSWKWQVEQPVVADAPETDWSGDDHPARFLIHVVDSLKAEHYFEIIWSNGALQAGQWKIIGNFHHYVANGGNAKTAEHTNTWFSESVNLLDLFHTATGRNDSARLINIAIFCDTDDTGAKSVAYFGDVSLGQ
jgi:Protein of unknown function (DUF3047)